MSKFRGGSLSQDASAGDDAETLRKKRVQIHSMREVPPSSADAGADYNSPDVQFILEVKRSNAKVTPPRPFPAIFPPNYVSRDAQGGEAHSLKYHRRV